MRKSTYADKFRGRSARRDDIQRIVDLFNASSQNTRGTNFTAVHWQNQRWDDAGINLETNSLLLFDGEQTVACTQLVSELPSVTHSMVGTKMRRYKL